MSKNVTARLALVVTLCGVAPGAVGSAAAQSKGAPVVTDRDRTEIQELVTGYAQALGNCAGEEYANMFVPDGYFASGPRGQITGHDKLVALVQSERHCNDKSARRSLDGPKVVVEASNGTVSGHTIANTNGGHYEDVYVKTGQGWRFKSRNFISSQEEAAKLTSQDFIEIRKLAGSATGHFDDVYSSGPNGKQLRSSGVVIAASPEGATGKVLLQADGGHYEDVYVKGSAGWRFKSRQYVAAKEEPTGTTGSR